MGCIFKGKDFLRNGATFHSAAVFFERRVPLFFLRNSVTFKHRYELSFEGGVIF